MEIVNLNPYTSIENRNFVSETTLKIGKSDFDNVEFENGTTVFSFIECKFRKIVIENNEQIDFEDISIQFID